MTLAVVLSLAALTVVCKGLAPALTRVPDFLSKRTAGLAPALLAALVMVELGGDDGVPQLDARAAGVGVAAVAAVSGAPSLVCVVLGAVTAAGLRAF